MPGLREESSTCQCSPWAEELPPKHPNRPAAKSLPHTWRNQVQQLPPTATKSEQISKEV